MTSPHFALSFDWNVKAGVFFEDPRMVRDLSKIIERWKNQSTLFDLTQNPSRWYDVLVSGILRIFQPLR